jgi:hypothetical protein
MPCSRVPSSRLLRHQALCITGEYDDVLKRPSMLDKTLAGEGVAPELSPRTLAALVTASLTATLAEAVSKLMGGRPMRLASYGLSPERLRALKYSLRLFPPF